jgi:hypothetical protein
VIGLAAGSIAFPAAARAATSCGVSNNHTICVTVPSGSLSGDTTITVTNSPNGGNVVFTWVPSGGPTTYLMTSFTPSPATGDYSFTWPTQKYLDASGVLKVQAGSSSQAAVNVSVTLDNGNATGFQHSPNDWASFGPPAWTGSSDPVVAAVGDGPSNEPASDGVAASVADSDPAAFLFLGDIYEQGTFTENLNHYGVSALDVFGSGGGTLWGRMAEITEPVVGNHENPHIVDWKDYWHGHPDTYAFTFGGVLFLGLNSSKPFGVGSSQYTFVQDTLPTAPGRCVVAFWHIPVLNGSKVNNRKLPMWQLLANQGSADLVLNGHVHDMTEYAPLNANLEAGKSDSHLVELISGAGGHSVGGVKTDSRVVFSKGRTPGALFLTLNGAAGGGTATSIGWSYEKTDGTVLRSGSTGC